MNIKRITITAAILLAAFAFAACGQTPDKAGQVSPESSASDSGAQPVSYTTWYGKVSEVAGNELTLELAKQPGEEEQQSSSAPAGDGETMQAAMMSPALPAGQADAGGAEQREELEMTGESKEFTVPGGLTIYDTAGRERQLSDIEKGAVLTIFTDENGAIQDLLLHA